VSTDLWSIHDFTNGFQYHWNKSGDNLEPLAEVERALLVVEVLHLPHPKLGGLLGGGNGLEHFCTKKTNQNTKSWIVDMQNQMLKKKYRPQLNIYLSAFTCFDVGKRFRKAFIGRSKSGKR
jgi:hypothetical protein